MFIILHVTLLPENWVQLLVGYEPKDTAKSSWVKAQKDFVIWNKKREHLRYFPKQCLSEQQNWESFKLKVHAYSWGAGTVIQEEWDLSVLEWWRGNVSAELGPKSL